MQSILFVAGINRCVSRGKERGVYREVYMTFPAIPMPEEDAAPSLDVIKKTKQKPKT